jgi:hypothetical protein
MVQPIVDSREEDPGKGVSPIGRVAMLHMLAGAQKLKPDDEKAAAELLKTALARQRFFKNLPRLDRPTTVIQARAAVDFVRWWQDEALLLPAEGEERREFVPTPWETKIHHHVFDRVIEARKVMLERRSTITLPDAFWLPCRTCGRIYESKAPHFARTCGACQSESPYEQRRRIHDFGAFPVFAGGFYPKGSQRRQYVWPTVCEHPECVVVFPAQRYDERYCPDHTRVEALRARRKDPTPKNERFRFLPNYLECDEGSEVRYDFVINGELRACIIGHDGYQARDEAEFRPLAFYAAANSLLTIVAVDTP